jgi:hypothetical protein
MLSCVYPRDLRNCVATSFRRAGERSRPTQALLVDSHSPPPSRRSPILRRETTYSLSAAHTTTILSGRGTNGGKSDTL